MSKPNFTLRVLQPSDSSAVEKLITEFDSDMTTRFLIDGYTAIIFGTEFRTAGVAVECAGFDGLVGMGTVRFNQAQFNDEVLPLAFLDGLKVHKDFRGQGLGYQIASWRIQQAREMYGDKCVIATGMLHDNHASHAVAKKWCREFLEQGVEVLVVPNRTQQPQQLDGVTVREIETHEFEEFSVKQNAYHKNHNLYMPKEPNDILKALAVSPGGKKLYRFFAAVDAAGNLLAGAQTWCRGMLKSDTINHPPPPLRLLNNVFHLLPPGFVIREVAVSGLWYQSDQLKAAQFMWEMIRWKCRELGTTITAGFDAHDPAREIVTLKPWHQPRPKITIAINGPAPINRQKLLFGIGRV